MHLRIAQYGLPIIFVPHPGAAPCSSPTRGLAPGYRLAGLQPAFLHTERIGSAVSRQRIRSSLLFDSSILGSQTISQRSTVLLLERSRMAERSRAPPFRARGARNPKGDPQINPRPRGLICRCRRCCWGLSQSFMKSDGMPSSATRWDASLSSRRAWRSQCTCRCRPSCQITCGSPCGWLRPPREGQEPPRQAVARLRFFLACVEYNSFQTGFR